MKIVQIVTLAHSGPFVESETWQKIQGDLLVGIRAVVWPKGSKKFTVHPQSGKKRGEGNGVTPIKEGLIKRLTRKDGTKRSQSISGSSRIQENSTRFSKAPTTSPSSSSGRLETSLRVTEH